ncbi:MAG: NAD-dependent malic enzyme [Francisellaceae bacterium]
MTRHFEEIRDESGQLVNIVTDLSKLKLLHDPFLNKGTAFTADERQIFDLIGLLPEKIETLDERVERAYSQLHSKNSAIGKYIFLNRLHETDMTMFYALARKYITEIMPLIYTPTVGEAVEKYSQIFRRNAGVFISINHADRIEQILSHYRAEDIDFIIVTDGEAVLGIGDQGIGGMDISIGKLMVYIICSGIDPSRVLPVQLDVGTNNQRLIGDPQYLGLKMPRAEGAIYDAFIDTFVTAVKNRFPGVYLHWEDFGRNNARRILNRYRDSLCTFNDDMQGTGIVAAANVIAGVKASGGRLKDQKVIMFGAGTAGCGIADQIADVMAADGVSLDKARSQIYLVDRFGLVSDSLDEARVPDFQKPYIKTATEIGAWSVTDPGNITLEEVVSNVHPQILIGVSTVKGAFTETIVRQMAKDHSHPIIMPLSNPNSHSEADPFDIIHWSEGRAIIAAGSPYDPVDYKGKSYRIAQGNNAFIFPGLGLGAIAVKARHVTDGMIRAACHTLSGFSPILDDPTAPILPDLKEVMAVSDAVAVAVAKQALAEGENAIEVKDIEKQIKKTQWQPIYHPYAVKK